MGQFVNDNVGLQSAIASGLDGVHSSVQVIDINKLSVDTHVCRVPNEHAADSRLAADTGVNEAYEDKSEETHSGGVAKLALLRPDLSCTDKSTLSPPSPPLPKLLSWKLNASSVKPYRYEKS